MRVAIIGAAGFVGTRVAQILGERGCDLTLLDRAPWAAPAGATVLHGDLSSPEIRAHLLRGADAVIHLAAILGGAAEADYPLARRVNVDATLDLFEDAFAKGGEKPLRMVFASTIAVYAKPMPDPVTDATPFGPTMVYGAQKLMAEVALSNFTAKGWLDGISLRPSGVMARDGADAALKSAFMSRLFWAVRRGEDIVLPVAETGRTWLTSIETVAQNFAHAALMGPIPAARPRAMTLPALSLTFGELASALRAAYPASASKITFAPDPALMALFGSYPRLDTAAADALGFVRDKTAADLVANSLPL